MENEPRLVEIKHRFNDIVARQLTTIEKLQPFIDKQRAHKALTQDDLDAIQQIRDELPRDDLNDLMDVWGQVDQQLSQTEVKDFQQYVQAHEAGHQLAAMTYDVTVLFQHVDSPPA